MEFRALGPIEFWSAGQREDLGSAKARSILGVLLLAPNTIVSAELLIDRLWDTRPTPKARQSLSVYVSRLRASLRQAAGDDVRLVGRARGYLLQLDPEAVDVHRFRRLRRQAGSVAASGDHGHAAALLREADALWRGQALTGMGGDWAARMRDSLEEERRAAIVERVECELELGRHGDLVAELGQLLAQYPLDEKLVAHQMTALYRSGRPADALSLYRETRGRLIDEQGTEPGSVLAELQQRILENDRVLAGTASSQRSRGVARPEMLPQETADFVGRHSELKLLAAQPDCAPKIAVIDGMPGVGKTALAVRAARLVSGYYPDGSLYLNLHAHDPGGPSLDPAEALRRLLQMLSVPPVEIPDSIGARSALWRANLSRRRVVVILDDASGYDQIRSLLPATGLSLILITARRRLPDYPGASTLTLEALSVDEAATLFRQIAGNDKAGDTDQVATIVELCGRLPLAIQHAATRVAQEESLNLAGLIEELSLFSARLGGTGAVSAAVMAAFDTSYQVLEVSYQRFFRKLGLNPCATVSLPAAAALGGCSLAETEKALAALVDCHLLEPASDGQFRFHDLIRVYAAVRAGLEDPKGPQRQAVRMLLDYYLHTADRAARVLDPYRQRAPVQMAVHVPIASPALGTQDDAAGWLESEWRNILQAARYAGEHEWKEKCADLIHLLADFMEMAAHWEEATAAHTLALQAGRDLADPARIARASLALSTVLQQAGRQEAALPLAEEAAATWQLLDDSAGEADALDQLGLAHQRAGRSREALAYFQEAWNLYREAKDLRGLATTLSHSGIASWHLGRYPEGYAYMREALSVYRDLGDRRGEATALYNLGKMHLGQGHHRDALDAFQKSLQIFREIGAPQNEAICYHGIGSVYHYKGSCEEGLAACRRALAIYRDIGDLRNESDVLNDIGSIYESTACYDEALVHYEKARLIAQELGGLSEQLIAARRTADIHRQSGRYGEALDHYHKALVLAREIGNLYEEGKVLEGIAESSLCIRRHNSATRIAFRQALDIFERLGVPEAESVRIRMETLNQKMGAFRQAASAL
jgi:DNA-binding SARP family transcriptional activator/tetratricopeptide (TPR) repeat protein